MVLGLVNHAVSIKKIVFTTDFKLQITAEDYINQAYQAYQAVYPASTSSPVIPDTGGSG